MEPQVSMLDVAERTESLHNAFTDDDIAAFTKQFSFTDQQIKEFLDSFSVFDRNCDGLITTAELGQVMTGLGHRPSLRELEALIKRVDMDKDGCVNFKEFLHMMAAKMDGDCHPEDELSEVFNVIDLDQDGFISTEDLQTILTKIGENISKEEVSEMVKLADTNTDGVVDFKEFKGMLHAK